jgi:hypothetical protein
MAAAVNGRAAGACAARSEIKNRSIYAPAVFCNEFGYSLTVCRAIRDGADQKARKPLATFLPKRFAVTDTQHTPKISFEPVVSLTKLGYA